ncbi:MAG: hypothetical protein ACOYN6_11445 [Ignavibacteria bacterium]
MAKVIDQHLGTVRGQLGPQVWKMVNGESYVARMPHPSLKEASPATIARRKKFGMTMKLVKMIVSLILLKAFWKDYDMDGSDKPYTVSNKVVKINYPNTTDTGYSDLMQLGPDFGFTINDTTFTVANTGIDIVFAAIGTETVINPAIETKCTLEGFIHFSDPINTGQFEHRFLPLVSGQSNLSLTNPMTFNFELNDTQQKIFDAYTTKKVYVALVTQDASNVPVHYSDTVRSA